jgi:serine protease
MEVLMRLALTAALVCAAHASASAAAAATDPYQAVIDSQGALDLVPGRVLVKVKGVDDASLLHFTKAGSDEGAALSAIAARTGLHLSFVRASLWGWALVDVRDATDIDTLPDEKQTRALIARLAADKAVDVVAEERWMKPLRTPNDPLLNQMWHLDQIGAKQAWDRTVGLSSQRVGIIDTGLVRNHPEFAGRVAGGFDFISSSSTANDGNGRDADFNDAGDACGGGGDSFHGTHVAGTIGAGTDNGQGIAGLNWNAGLVIARALGRCGGSIVDIMEAAAWMVGARINGVPDVGANKVSVMNLSLGSAGTCSSFEQQIVDFVNGAGTIMVVAAGNDGGAIGSPANCRGTVSVGAVGPTNARTGYSSFGANLTFMAPGGDFRFSGGGVLSTLGTAFGSQQGTSMAAPHVAGAISLIQAAAPSMSRAAIVDLLRATGASCTNCQGIPAIRIGAALASLGGGTPTTPPPPPPPPPTPPAGDDQWEDNDTAATATRATCGVNEGRLIAAAGDQDWFSFTPPANQRIAIDLDGGSPDLDLYIVSDDGRSILARSESNTGVERLSGTASGRPLKILVNPYTDTQRGVAHAGPYRLTIRCGAAATTQSADVETDTFVDGNFDDPIVGGEATDQLEEPIVEELVGDDLIDVGGVGGGAIPTASGGCSAAGHPSQAAFALVLLGLLRRRRR